MANPSDQPHCICSLAQCSRGHEQAQRVAQSGHTVLASLCTLLLADTHDYISSIKKQYHLISLIDKVKNFVIIILYDIFVNKRMLLELLYHYGDGKPAPITVYIYFDTNCKIKDHTSYCYNIFYDKWSYYF